MTNRRLFPALAAAVMLAVACGQDPPPPPAPTGPTPEELEQRRLDSIRAAQEAAEAARRAAEEAEMEAQRRLEREREEAIARARDVLTETIYFDFDESEIKPEFESILQGAAQAIRDSGASVVIEGHTDERGSEEYNIALGERRAFAIRQYLYNLGVSASQLSTVSYGESRPAVNGTGETAWQLNRRGEFIVR